MMLFRSNSGQGGESLLLNFAAGSVFHTSWQAGESTYIAAESPVGQLLLLSWVYDDLSDNWFQTYQQYLAPASDPTIMTPVAMWEIDGLFTVCLRRGGCYCRGSVVYSPPRCI